MWLKAFCKILTVRKWLLRDDTDSVHFLSCKTIGDHSSRYEKLCAPKHQPSDYYRLNILGASVFAHLGVDAAVQGVLLVFRTSRCEKPCAPETSSA